MGRRSIIILSSLLVFIAAASAQQPKLKNAKVETVSAGASLQNTVKSIVEKQSGPAWMGYSIPVTRKERTMCCSGSNAQDATGCCQGCRLEREGQGFFNTSSQSECSPLEPADFAFVMLRMEGQKITKVRTFTPECPLDAAGLTVYWLTEANPAQSLDLLTQIAEPQDANGFSRKHDPTREAVRAVALHNIPQADAVLGRWTGAGNPEWLREQAALMLGIERGKVGLTILRSAIRQDPSEAFRRKALIGFALSDQPEAVQDLIYLAKNDGGTEVRSQALFWLAQRAGKKEVAQITDSIENDPETEVKRKAVFALSQMPKDEGVPLLIQVARNNKNPEVRREAIRWLGFSNDPRALDFIEQILTK